MKSVVEVRDELVRFARRDLIGPEEGGKDAHEVLEERPSERYVAGVLFPQGMGRDESAAVGGVEDDTPGGDPTPPDADSGVELQAIAGVGPEGGTPGQEKGSQAEGEAEATDGAYDEVVTLANTYRPSAMGLSFLADLTASALQISVQAACYEQEVQATGTEVRPQRPTWRRVPFQEATTQVRPAEDRVPVRVALTNGLELHVVFRRVDRLHLVTVSLLNPTHASEATARTFFQVGFSVRATDGTPIFPEYRSRATDGLAGEEASLELLYRFRRVFAIGHGCAADWAPPERGRTRGLFTASMPDVRIPPIVARSGTDLYLRMDFLAGRQDGDSRTEVPRELRSLCEAYGAWIRAREAELGTLEGPLEAAGRDHMDLCRRAAERMRRGIALLERDDDVFEAFRLTNEVMLQQQFHAKRERKLTDPWIPLPERHQYVSGLDGDGRAKGYWRTFQIAFLLMTLSSLGDTSPHADEAERDLVDLIWFPTGGGKTEAYLAASAFSILLGRLRREGTGEGCKILMRYTLRLLTSQQFQRAASVICALERLRRTDPSRLGKAPIRIGLWVGSSLTPNREADAKAAIQRLTRERSDPGVSSKNPFVLLACPWCGTSLDDPDRLGYRWVKGRQFFVCPSEGHAVGSGACPFSTVSDPLPVVVVDESVYDKPPTLLIGTVDKFAMLAFEESASRIFSVGGGPVLIIQDELHLISGPLGSMVGLYEGLIDYLCSRNGTRPKVIASTATIRRATDQCRALFDREMFQFPPPGLDASDSYFAYEDADVPGRVYVGLLPTAASSPLTAQIRGVVALHQGILLVVGATSEERLIDPYWTLVQYFSSLKELGRAATFVTADIPEALPRVHQRHGVPSGLRRWLWTSEELTSRKDEDEVPKILRRLGERYADGQRFRSQALDTVLATNMIAVGMDVDRLGLMMIVTQPKGTSEYIQASSRVGRSVAAPGLICTIYNAARPRDRSHFERFRNFHEAFYRHVEPTSVTPFAPPVLDRALHGVLVAAVRNLCQVSSPQDFREGDPDFVAFRDFLRRRVQRVDPGHLADFDERLESRLQEWRLRGPPEWGGFRDDHGAPVLQRPAGSVVGAEGEDVWATPTSMRNVDRECVAQVIKQYGRVEWREPGCPSAMDAAPPTEDRTS